MGTMGPARTGAAGSPARGRPRRPVLGGTLRLLAALAVALLALALPGTALADGGGSVEIGVAAGKLVEAPEAGSEGSVELAAAVGVAKAPDGSAGGAGGGVVEVGAAIGFRDAAVCEFAAAFDAGKGAFPGGSPRIERTVPDGARLSRPVPDPERAGWQFAGWHLAGAPDPGWDADGASAVPLGEAWDFSRRVGEDVELHARWLRLSGSGSVELGVTVVDRVAAPGVGGSGSALLGVAVGLGRRSPQTPRARPTSGSPSATGGRAPARPR